MKRALFSAALTGLLGACQTGSPADAMSPMVGGPCRYDSKEVTAAVVQVFDDAARMQEDGTSIVFEVELQRFAEPPAVGQQYTMSKRFIVEGTCTPYTYMPGARIESSVDAPTVSAE